MNAIDTNIWLYTHDTRDPHKQAIAQQLVATTRPLALLWQVGCEFIAASRKLAPLGFTEDQAPGPRGLAHELHSPGHPPKVPLIAIVRLIELVAQLQQRRHPDLFLIVLDHRFHRPILIDDRAHPAPEPARSATGRRAIDDERTLAPFGRPLVHAQQRLVVVAPGVLDLHQVEPDIVIGPVLGGRVDDEFGSLSLGLSRSRTRRASRCYAKLTVI